MKQLLAIILLFGFKIVVFSQTNEEIANQKLKKAIEIMDKGNTDMAIELLKEAKQLDPESFIYDYETGFAYYLKSDLKTAIKYFKQTFKYNNVTDQAYQMAGNLTDEAGDSKKALKLYDQGLKKFPNSGRLYLEKGTVYMMKKDYNQAFEMYEKGIKVDPAYPSNYYKAAVLYSYTDEKVWTMIYGEMLMNLEKNTQRTADISKLLYDTYKSEINIGKDTTKVSFSKNNTIYLNSKNLNFMDLLPFGSLIYEPTLLVALNNEREIDIHSLNRIRERFIDFYFEKEFQKTHPKPLFNYQKKIKDAGHMEAYNYWILMKGDENAFIAWKNDNKEKWDNFLKWFSENSITSCFENNKDSEKLN